MTFLAPFYLLFAAAAAVPLLIHLLRRRSGRQVDFPAVRYLQRAERENRRTLRLRNLLLMMLRVAAVVLLAVAASRPMARWIGSSHGPAAVAMVLDNTASSGAVVAGHPVLDRLSAAAASVLDVATPADRLWLLTANGEVAGGSPASVRSAAALARPWPGAADLPAVVRRAAGLVRASGMADGAVVVLTDAQRTSWDSTARHSSADAARLVVWTPVTAAPTNRGVTFAAARPTRWTPRGAVVARFDSRDSVTYRVMLGGRTLARGTAPANEETVVHVAPAERGWVAGSVELAPDELSVDDARYFAAWIGAPPAVFAAPAAGEFAAAAIDALRGAGRITAGRDIAVGPAEEISALPALIVAPSDPVRLGAANRALDRLGVPWRFGARRIGKVDATGVTVGSIAVADRYELISQSGAIGDTLAAIGAGPWIVAGPRYVLIGSPLTAEASSLPIRAAWIPWFESVVSDRLSGEPGAVVEATPGAVVRAPLGVDRLERPDGTRISAGGDTLRAPDVPGVYLFVSGAKRVGALVVNAPVSESRLERFSGSDLAAKLGATWLETPDGGPALANDVFRAASRRSVLPAVLLALLAVLGAETLLVAVGRRESA